MTAEGVAAADDGPTVKLSNDCLPEETLERSKVGNKFEKIKCAKAGDMMFTEVSDCDDGLPQLPRAGAVAASSSSIE